MKGLEHSSTLLTFLTLLLLSLSSKPFWGIFLTSLIYRSKSYSLVVWRVFEGLGHHSLSALEHFMSAKRFHGPTTHPDQPWPVSLLLLTGVDWGWTDLGTHSLFMWLGISLWLVCLWDTGRSQPRCPIAHQWSESRTCMGSGSGWGWGTNQTVAGLMCLEALMAWNS